MRRKQSFEHRFYASNFLVENDRILGTTSQRHGFIVDPQWDNREGRGDLKLCQDNGNRNHRRRTCSGHVYAICHTALPPNFPGHLSSLFTIHKSPTVYTLSALIYDSVEIASSIHHLLCSYFCCVFCIFRGYTKQLDVNLISFVSCVSRKTLGVQLAVFSVGSILSETCRIIYS